MYTIRYIRGHIEVFDLGFLSFLGRYYARGEGINGGVI